MPLVHVPGSVRHQHIHDFPRLDRDTGACSEPGADRIGAVWQCTCGTYAVHELLGVGNLFHGWAHVRQSDVRNMKRSGKIV